MKKLSILMLGVLGMMAATSCEEKIDPATPQENAKEPIFEAKDVVSAKAGALEVGAVDLKDYTAEGATVPVMKLVSDEGLPEGATVTYKLQLSDTENFARVQTLTATEGEDDVYYVSAEEWEAAHLYLFGKSPKVKVAYYRVPVYVNLDGSDYRLNSVNYYAAQGTIEEMGQDVGFTISDAYYFLSDATSWSLGDAEAMAPFKFDHSEADVYDDPVFTFKFKLTEADFTNTDGTTKDGIYWKIASQEGMDLADWATGIFGPEENGDENLSGVLVDQNAQAGKLTETGTYKLTINMEEMTYDFELMLQPEFLYTPGGANGWSQANSAYLQLNEEKGYYGLMPVDGAGFKICTEDSWDDAVTYGSTVATAALSGTLGKGSAGNNILVENPGLYWIFVHFDTAYELTTFDLTEVTSVGIIGGFAASGWGTDVLMTSDDNVTWTCEATFAAGDEWKFRFNGNWDYNYGGALNAPTLDGDNFKVDEAGTYTITLTLQPGMPKATMVKK